MHVLALCAYKVLLQKPFAAAYGNVFTRIIKERFKFQNAHKTAKKVIISDSRENRNDHVTNYAGDFGGRIPSACNRRENTSNPQSTRKKALTIRNYFPKYPVARGGTVQTALRNQCNASKSGNMPKIIWQDAKS